MSSNCVAGSFIALELKLNISQTTKGGGEIRRRVHILRLKKYEICDIIKVIENPLLREDDGYAIFRMR